MRLEFLKKEKKKETLKLSVEKHQFLSQVITVHMLQPWISDSGHPFVGKRERAPTLSKYVHLYTDSSGALS